MRITVPNQTLEMFRERAKKNRRSVTQEILFALENLADQGQKGGESSSLSMPYQGREYPRR